MLSAQSASDLEQRVSTLVSRWPAADGAAMMQQADSLISLGPEAISILCRDLTGVGLGGDPAPQFALQGIVHTICLPGREKDQRMVTQAVLRWLSSSDNVPVKAFLLRQLRLCSDNRLREGIRPFLTDENLCSPAASIFVTIGNDHAMDDLITALKGSSGSCAPTLIQALGTFHTAKIFKPLAPYTASSDPEVRKAALDAIASTGYPPAYDMLKDIPVTASKTARKDAVFRLITFAERLHEERNTGLAESICREILTDDTADDAAPRCAALSLLARIKGPSIEHDLLAVVDSLSPELRATALRFAQKLPGRTITADWIEKMATADPALQVMIIDMLGRRGDRTAVPVMIESVRSSDIEVRAAAAEAGARLAGDDFLPEFLDLFKQADSSLAIHLKSLLLSYMTTDVLSELASALPLFPAAAQIAVIEAIASRRADTETAAVFARTASDKPGVRLAAMQALASLAVTGYTGRLIALLRHTEDPDEAVALRNALVTSSGGSSRDILSVLDDMAPDERIRFLPVLAELGDDACLIAVQRDTECDDPQLRAAAIEALASWRSSAALVALYSIARRGVSDKERNTAVDGYLRILAAEKNTLDGLAGRLSDIQPFISTDSQRKLFVQTLSALHSDDALALTASYLDVPSVASEAALAAAAIVSTAAVHPSDTVMAVMLRALYRCRDPYVSEQITSYLERHDPERMRFRSLFNGEDLSGWKRHDNLPGHGLAGRWFVENGVIVGMQDPPGQGGFLVTERQFTDFDLRMDVQIDWPFDSGVFLRVGPEGKSHQVTLDYREGGEIGGVYLPWVRGFVYHNSEAAAMFKRDEWNAVRIVCLGEPPLIRVWLNGTLITDFQHTPESTAGVPAKGGIALQVHPGGEGFDASKAMFRNILIREIR